MTDNFVLDELDHVVQDCIATGTGMMQVGIGGVKRVKTNEFAEYNNLTLAPKATKELRSAELNKIQSAIIGTREDAAYNNVKRQRINKFTGREMVAMLGSEPLCVANFTPNKNVF